MIFLPVKIDELIGYDYVAALSKKLAVDPDTKALKIKSDVTIEEHNHDTVYLKLIGGILTGFLTLSGAPTSYLHAATKKYVDDNIVTNHGDLSGLGDDDHAQYYNQTRGDNRYLKKVDDIHGICFILKGVATTGAKKTQALIPCPLTISTVIIYSDVAPTGSSLIVDVNKNGTTIFTTQGNRPEIAISGHSDESGTPDVTSLAKGNRVSIDVDQIGSTVAGGDDLTIAVIC